MGQRADEIDVTRRFGEGQLDATNSAIGAEAQGAPIDDAPEAAEIRADIEHTRTEMSETIDAIAERLNPERVKDQVLEQAGQAYESAKEAVRDATIGRAERFMENVSESVRQVTEPALEAMGPAGTFVGETSTSVLDTIKRNPLPTALIGLGVGMLIMRRNRGGSNYREYEYYRSDIDDYDRLGDTHYAPQRRGASVVERARTTAGEVAGRAQDVVSSAAGSIRDTAGSVADRTRERVDHLSEQARQGARNAGDQFQTLLRENPLALGAAALAAGAVVGLAVPSTRLEGKYLGETRDQLVDKAQQMAKNTANKVQQVTQEAKTTLQQEAQNRGTTPGSRSDSRV